jgi:hypothetical protein
MAMLRKLVLVRTTASSLLGKLHTLRTPARADCDTLGQVLLFHWI